MSLASRGIALILVVLALAVLPFAIADRWRTVAERRLIAEGAVAFLASGLDQYLKLASAGASSATANPWITASSAESERIRWAAACRADGVCVEFVRRFAVPREAIITQVDVAAAEPTLRPLGLADGAESGLALLTMPVGDGSSLAAVMEIDSSALAASTAASLALYAGPIVALLVGLVGFHLAIVRPVRRVGYGVGRAEAALHSAAAGDSLPEELASLARRVQETEQELSRWRGEAGALKHSLDRRLEARTADVTRALRQAERAANTDALTQLGNRRVLERELPGMFATQRENGDELSVIWFDIDKFKQFNDTRGHQAGDDLIRFAGGLFESAARREGDLAIRYGGDEFVLALRGTALHEAVEIARRLGRLFDQHARTLGEMADPPSLSAGVASLLRSEPLDADDLLRLADEAMYVAKRGEQAVVAVDRHPR